MKPVTTRKDQEDAARRLMLAAKLSVRASLLLGGISAEVVPCQARLRERAWELAGTCQKQVELLEDDPT